MSGCSIWKRAACLGSRLASKHSGAKYFLVALDKLPASSLQRPVSRFDALFLFCSALAAWPSREADAVRYLDFCATTVSTTRRRLQRACASKWFVTCCLEQVSSSSQPISSQPAAAGASGSQGMQPPNHRKPSSSSSSSTSSAAAPKKVAKSSQEISNAAAFASTTKSNLSSSQLNQQPQQIDTPPAVHPASFSGGRSLLPPAPSRPSTSASSTPRVPAPALPVSSVDFGGWRGCVMRHASFVTKFIGGIHVDSELLRLSQAVSVQRLAVWSIMFSLTMNFVCESGSQNDARIGQQV